MSYGWLRIRQMLSGILPMGMRDDFLCHLHNFLQAFIVLPSEHGPIVTMKRWSASFRWKVTVLKFGGRKAKFGEAFLLLKGSE
jgi:hypothetical protein